MHLEFAQVNWLKRQLGDIEVGMFSVDNSEDSLDESELNSVAGSGEMVSPIIEFG